jgi:C1A family cysteine protease
MKGGWLPDQPDHRDVPYRALREDGLLARAASAFTRPSAHYLKEDNLPRIYHQGPIGSCVGHGVATACAYAIDWIFDPQDGMKPADLSRLYAYFIARRNKAADEGAYIRDAMKAISRFGICDESVWPYDVAKWHVRPPEAVYNAACRRAEGIRYFRLDSLADMLDCIASGFPIVYGMVLFDGFDLVDAQGTFPMPSKKDPPRGGHCMTIVGYSMKRRAFYVRNSWGESWGQRGHCWVPFDYALAHGADFWTIRRCPK